MAEKFFEVASKPPSKGLFSENLLLNWSLKLRGTPLLAGHERCFEDAGEWKVNFWNLIMDNLYIPCEGTTFHQPKSLEKLKKTPWCHLADKPSTQKEPSLKYSLQLTYEKTTLLHEPFIRINPLNNIQQWAPSLPALKHPCRTSMTD